LEGSLLSATLKAKSKSAQLGKSLRLAGNIAAPTETIAVEIGPGLRNYALLRKAMDRRKDGKF
jgi:hypothetical protein